MNLCLKTIKYITTIILIVVILGACSGHKKHLDFREVRNGDHLDTAIEVSLETFVPIWLANTRPSKGATANLNQLHQDTSFTYFGKQTSKSQDFIKVKTADLDKFDYKSLNGDSLRMNFYDEIISIEDKRKTDGNSCSTKTIDIDFIYRFIAVENVIEVKCHYKVNCGIMIGPRLVNSNYIARYNVTNRTFVKG